MMGRLMGMSDEIDGHGKESQDVIAVIRSCYLHQRLRIKEGRN